nr:hypothetical protein [Tanacetum cinerariifolium]
MVLVLPKPSGSGVDEGTGSKPGVPDVPIDESEEELTWNSTDDEGADDEGKDGDDDEEDERDDDDEGEEDDDDENKDGDAKDDADEDKEVAKHDDKDDTEESGDDDEEDSEDEDDGEEDLDLNIGNKSIQRSDEQRNLYKSLVDAYESDKIILNTYEESVTLKRRRDDDDDKDEEPSVRPDRGSKRRREGKEPESASTLSETATKSAGKSTTGSRSQQASASADDQPIVQSSKHPEWFSQPQKPPSPNHHWNKTLPAVHKSIQMWISELAKQADTRSSFNELMDTPLDFSNFI